MNEIETIEDLKRLVKDLQEKIIDLQKSHNKLFLTLKDFVNTTCEYIDISNT